MASRYTNLATLTWLDRRQLWATTNRAAALGVNTVPVHPSMLGGQGSRPSVTHRHFAMSLSWFVYTALAVFGLVLASALALLSVKSAAAYILKKLVLHFDSALATTVKKQNKYPAQPSPIYGLEPANASTNFASLVYSLVGSLDSTSSYVPLCKTKTPVEGPLC